MNNDKINREMIVKDYIDGLSIMKICDKYNLSYWAGRSIVYDAGVLRSRSEATKKFKEVNGHGNRYIVVDEIILRRLYLEEKNSIQTITEITGTKPTTIYCRLCDMGIIRNSSEANLVRWGSPEIDYELIIYKYTKENKGVSQVAEECGLSQTLVYNILKPLGLIRNLSEASKINWSKPAVRMKIVSNTMAKSHQRPTDGEIILREEIKNLGIPYIYNGDYSSKININGKIPDFIDMTNKRVILFNGCFWHYCPICNTKNSLERYGSILSVKEIEDIENIKYIEEGYEVLVIWGHELSPIDKVRDNINDFQRRCDCVSRMGSINPKSAVIE